MNNKKQASIIYKELNTFKVNFSNDFKFIESKVFHSLKAANKAIEEFMSK